MRVVEENMDVLKVIDALRQTDYYIDVIFMQGACYKFHLFLKALFPDAKPLINNDKDHVVSLVDGKLYDITGEVDGAGYRELSGEDLKLVRTWTFAGNKLISLGECQNCEEPIYVVK